MIDGEGLGLFCIRPGLQCVPDRTGGLYLPHRDFKTSKGFTMKLLLAIPVLLAMSGLSACYEQQPDVVVAPAAVAVPGPAGATGATGEQGTQGATGEQGAMGDQGNQGVEGDQGVQGNQGNDGADGADGDPPKPE
jgi:hypothetical protein